jgi:hypothetical protein
MSIIHEALKKVQDSLHKKDAAKPDSIVQPLDLTTTGATAAAPVTPAAPAAFQAAGPLPEQPNQNTPTPGIVDIEPAVRIATFPKPIFIVALVVALIAVYFILTNLSLGDKTDMVVRTEPAPVAKKAPAASPAPVEASSAPAALPLPEAAAVTQPTAADVETAAVPAEEKPVVTAPSPTLPPINIQGVMNNGGESVALINDQIYEVGDEINGAKILSITVTAVTISMDGIEETIPVGR